MAQAKITLIGLENYLNPDHSVFENMQLPDGIDKDTLIGAIILRCQEFELLYSDPDFMIAAVNVWSRKNYWTFDKWVKLINKDYDPLYNKDYYEEYEDSHQGAESGSGTSLQTDDHTITDDHTRTDNLKSETDGTVTHAEKAFNDTNMVDISKDTTDGEVKHTGTQRDAGTQRNTGSLNGSYSDSKNDSYTNNHTYHGYGNIGITSAQELFQRQAEVARFNLYEQIADLFCQEFCIMVY